MNDDRLKCACNACERCDNQNRTNVPKAMMCVLLLLLLLFFRRRYMSLCAKCRTLSHSRYHTYISQARTLTHKQHSRLPNDDMLRARKSVWDALHLTSHMCIVRVSVFFIQIFAALHSYVCMYDKGNGSFFLSFAVATTRKHTIPF